MRIGVRPNGDDATWPCTVTEPKLAPWHFHWPCHCGHAVVNEYRALHVTYSDISVIVTYWLLLYISQWNILVCMACGHAVVNEYRALRIAYSDISVIVAYWLLSHISHCNILVFMACGHAVVSDCRLQRRICGRVAARPARQACVRGGRGGRARGREGTCAYAHAHVHACVRVPLPNSVDRLFFRAGYKEYP